MTGQSVRHVLFQCDGALAPAAWTAQDWTDRREITSGEEGADLDLHLQSLAGRVLTRVGPRAADLVRIAAYAYRADQMISRGEPDNASATRWRRHLALCVPVNEPSYWSDPVVNERLAATLRFATDDTWAFAFSLAPPRVGQLPLDVRDQEVLGHPRAVVLLSGGADSLCVLLEAAANGERPVAVGHWSTASHRIRQQDILDRARGRLAWQFPQIGFRIHRQGAAAADNSQRTRAFLFAALGAAVAGEIGVERVYLGDNGPVSLNLPINDQLVGALASRSTHPEFLARFNRLLEGMFAAPVVVSNPLRDRTRAETLGVLKETHCEDLLTLTLSCSKWRNLPAATPHCGGCSQCVDRRFAAIAAGLEAHDPAKRYKHDIFTSELPGWDDRTTALSYVRFARRVNRLSDDQLLESFPQLYEAVVPGGPSPDAVLRELLDLTKRHARTVLDVLTEMTGRNLAAFVAGDLPLTCLVSLAARELSGPATVDGPLPERPSAPVRPAPTADVNGARVGEAENVFALQGEMWTLSYAGVTTHLKPTVGLTRIACLLAEPGRELTAGEILAQTDPAGPSPMSQEEAELEGLRPEVYAGGGMILDRRAEVHLQEAIRDLLRQRDDARDAGDTQRGALLDEQITQIAQELKVGTGLGGRLKPFADNLTKSHETVYQSIHRALPRITKAHPPLGKHLNRSLRRGTTFTYAPETDIRWHVEFPKASG